MEYINTSDKRRGGREIIRATKIRNKAGRARSRVNYATLIKGKDGFGTRAKIREGERKFILFKLTKVTLIRLKMMKLNLNPYLRQNLPYFNSLKDRRILQKLTKSI